jgi:mannan endo-1,4-beta-mannosidase
LSSSTISWWAASRSRARVTAASVTVLALVLAGLTYVVWASPDSALRKATDTAISAVNPLTAQNAQLRSKLAAAEGTVIAQKKKLLSASAAAASAAAAHAKAMATAQQQVVAAQHALANVKAQAALNASGSGSSGSGASGAGDPSTAGATSRHGSTPAVISAPSRATLVAPAKRYFGMYTEQAPFNWATLDATSKKIGVQPNMVGYFSGWDEKFRTSAVTRAWSTGRLPLMTWESRPISAGNDSNVAPDYSLPKIIGGSFDAYLHQYAKDIVSTGLPLAIRLDHEMNGTWYPWSELNGGNRPINGNNVGDYVKMWRHVHDIFQQEGANALVIWIWAPNIVNNMQPSSHATQSYLNGLYPGDSYVDWVGLSGYLRPPYRAGNDFTFGYTYGASLKQLRTLTTKPILLAEVGASETGGHKAAWLTSFFDGFSDPANADLIGFSWFSLAITSYVSGERSTNDWRIDSRSDSLRAFSTGLAKPEAGFALMPAD